MKTINGERFLTIGEVSEIVLRGVQTIKAWYKWAEDNNCTEQLPEVHRDIDQKGTRYFRETDLHLMKVFRDSVKYGNMAEQSRTRWGKRGKEIAARKAKKRSKTV